MSTPSDSKFWITRIGAMLAVVLCGVSVLLFMPKEGDDSDNSSSNMSAQEKMVQNVTNFYSEFRQTSADPITEKYGEYVISYEVSDEPIQKQLQKMQASGFPDANNWIGAFERRSFAEGSTLFTESQTHILNNGMNLIWALNQDFVIKHRFVSENTVAGMLSEIAAAVDANFVNTVQVYFCDADSTFVITDKQDDYLTAHCRLFKDNF